MLSQADIVALIDSRVAKQLAAHRDTWLSPKETAALVSCHIDTVANLCRNGVLRFSGEGRARRISRASINEHMTTEGGRGIAA